MRWLADECIDAGSILHLRAAGHDVLYTAELAPSTSDTDVMGLARIEQRLLLTEDKDFGDLVFRRGLIVPGIVLLRISPALHALKGFGLMPPSIDLLRACWAGTLSSRKREYAHDLSRDKRTAP